MKLCSEQLLSSPLTSGQCQREFLNVNLLIAIPAAKCPYIFEAKAKLQRSLTCCEIREISGSHVPQVPNRQHTTSTHIQELQQSEHQQATGASSRKEINVTEDKRYALPVGKDKWAAILKLISLRDLGTLHSTNKKKRH